MNIKKILKKIIEYSIITLGDVLIAIGVSIFLVPNRLSTGGFSGLATILNFYINIDVGTWIIILNSILIIISIYLFGIRFVFRTSMSILIFGILTNFFATFNPLTNDLFLSSVCGGILSGIGIGLNIKENCTTGGSELLAKILNHFIKKINLTQVILILDAIIVSLFIVVFKNIDSGLYSVISIFLSTKTIDVILEGINYSTLVNIVSDKNDIIADAIIQNVKRGVTLLDAQGYYTKEKKKMIYCITSKYQIQQIKEIVNKIDGNAFVIISSVKEVLGEGFDSNLY